MRSLERQCRRKPAKTASRKLLSSFALSKWRAQRKQSLMFFRAIHFESPVLSSAQTWFENLRGIAVRWVGFCFSYILRTGGGMR